MYTLQHFKLRNHFLRILSEKYTSHTTFLNNSNIFRYSDVPPTQQCCISQLHSNSGNTAESSTKLLDHSPKVTKNPLESSPKLSDQNYQNLSRKLTEASRTLSNTPRKYFRNPRRNLTDIFGTFSRKFAETT